MTDRFRETFYYLMEIQLQPQDYKKIEKFEAFIKLRSQELKQTKLELKQLRSKCVSEHRATDSI